MNSTLISILKTIQHDQGMSTPHVIFPHRFIRDLMSNMEGHQPQVHTIVHQDNSNQAFCYDLI